jgi:hypothetical protein
MTASKFNGSDGTCRDCQQQYYHTLSDYDNSGVVRNYYEALSLVAVKAIQKQMKQDKLFKSYAQNIKKHMCF